MRSQNPPSCHNTNKRRSRLIRRYLGRVEKICLALLSFARLWVEYHCFGSQKARQGASILLSEQVEALNHKIVRIFKDNC
eukprot:2105392-Pleurochrysis_carterae.AAC.2